MTTTKHIKCEDITVPKNRKHGQFANAFRILPDTGEEYLLDFLIYSKSESSATVVARIRVMGHMLGMIRDRLGHTMTEMQNRKGESPPITFVSKSSGEVH